MKQNIYASVDNETVETIHLESGTVASMHFSSMKILSAVFIPAVVVAELQAPGFTNPINPAFNYTGTRVMETNYTANKYSDASWYQSTTIDADNNIYLADKSRHVIVKIPATSAYHNFPSEGFVYSGRPGRAGHRDGSLDVALYNGMKGVAHVLVAGQEYLYISDTLNHCIRRIDMLTRRVITVAGVPGAKGHLDGDGRKALFDSPTSVGVDGTTGLVFVHDSRDLVRMLNVTDTPSGETWVTVSTLVSGACRPSGLVEKVHETIFRRPVRCQTEWVTTSPGSTEPSSLWVWPNVCLGNSVTCSTRYSDEL